MTARERFVGRHAELADLGAWMTAACSGAGGVALICGPPGIGKTRLVEEVTSASAGTAQVVWGRAVDDLGAPPLWPWRRILRALPTVEAAAAQALNGVDLARQTSVDTDAARFQLAATCTDALLRHAQDQPLVLVLEDLHWADEATLALLVHVAGELVEAPILVIGTYRDGASAALDAAIPDLLRLPGVHTQSLRPLSEEEVGTYLQGSRSQPVAADVACTVHQRCGGNPLYLRTLDRLISADGLSAAEGGVELRHLAEVTVGRLDSTVRELVEAASVIGEEVELAVIAAVTGKPLPKVSARLDIASRNGVLISLPDLPGRWRFAHALVRDGVYADLAPSVRARLHARTAQALEPSAERDHTLAGVVAGHWLRAAGDQQTLRRASHWATRAASSATGTLAFGESAKFLTMALDALNRADASTEERCDLLLDLSAAQFRSGQLRLAVERATQAADLGQQLERPDLVAAAALTVHDVNVPDLLAPMESLCERVLTTHGDPPPTRTTSRLLSARSSMVADSGRFTEALPLAVEALRRARACDDAQALIDATRARMKIEPLGISTQERLQLGELAIDLAGKSGQPLTQLWGHKWRMEAALDMGEMNLVNAESAQVQGLATTTRLPLIRWHDRRLRASLAVLQGRFDHALTLNDEAARINTHELTDDSIAHGLTYAFLLQLALMSGDTSRMTPRMWDIVAAPPEIPIILVSRPLVLLMLGRRDEAQALYEGLRPLAAVPNFATMAQGVPLNMVHLVEEFDDVSTAEVLLSLMRKMTPTSAAGLGIFCSGSSARELGRLALVCGDYEEAIAQLQGAVEVNIRIGARPYVAHARHELAEGLLGRGDPADLPTVLTLTRQSADEAARLGMPGAVAAATHLHDRASLLTRETDPLTPREREICDLLVEGLNNRGIAADLVLSERTVESHVRNILAKLNLSNRHEIATWALRRIPAP
jgi:DNA-binding CsgD family transcriptional regulator